MREKCPGLPVFGLHGAAKAKTAAISIAAGIVIWRVIPKANRLPSTGELEALYRELAAEIARRGALETELRAIQARLAARVAERTGADEPRWSSRRLGWPTALRPPEARRGYRRDA